jgi:rhodanese-related sulfurtransferase/rubrerythrin
MKRGKGILEMATKHLITLTPKELATYVRDTHENVFLLVDVRQPAEYKEAHIPGSRLIPLPELEQRISELPDGMELIFYCRSGSRSAAAAFLALEAGATPENIYHLGGGILSWEGKTLSDFPRVQVFRGAETPAQFLKKAMELEKGAWLFYRAVQSRQFPSPLAAIMEKMSIAEIGHAETVYRFLQKQNQAIPSFDTLFEKLPGEILENGEPVEKAVSRLETLGELDCVRIIELALDIEYAAFDLYRNMAEHENTREAAEAFYTLAQAEKSHLRTFAEALALCPEAS